MAARVWVDLIMDNGELVRIECPSKHEDDLHKSLEHCMKRRDWWSPYQFDGCKAEYMGILLDRVNMGRVVGEL
ncbi:MAG: hypothetical protein KZQ84_10170 [Candidatus Thiodiazotropha sp. (ex Lucinoma borealis)]|nr:hypothetical protein [Candidatus Thiodiazotropha sp. (ex Lucinoma borealis)]